MTTLGMKFPNRKRPIFTSEHKRNISLGTKKEEESHFWKGDSIGYRGIHHWVDRKLGKPQFCEECKRTKPPKGLGKTRSYFHWANKSGEYFRDVKDWKRLCYKCHKKFDKGRKMC